MAQKSFRKSAASGRAAVARAPRDAILGSKPSGEFHPLNLPLSQALVSGCGPEIRVRFSPCGMIEFVEDLASSLRSTIPRRNHMTSFSREEAFQILLEGMKSGSISFPFLYKFDYEEAK